MTIDELEKQIDQLEKAEVLDHFAGELITSDTSHLCWLYKIAKENGLKAICWPKIILIPEADYARRNTKRASRYLATYERLYRNGIVNREGIYRESRLEEFLRKIRTIFIEKSHRSLSWKENERKYDYEYLNNLKDEAELIFNGGEDISDDNRKTNRS